MARIHILVACSLLLIFASCSDKVAQDPEPEDYNKIFTLKPAEKTPLEAGVWFKCFPREVGELGFDPKRVDYVTDDVKTYKVHLQIYFSLEGYAQNEGNRTTATLQYLDAEGNLVVENLLDDSDHSGYDDTIEKVLELESGQVFYYALFVNPENSVYMTLYPEVRDAEDNELGDDYYQYVEYDRKAESFHITDLGQSYYIYSGAMLLP